MIKIAICEDDDISMTILYEQVESYMLARNYISQIETYTTAELLLQSGKIYDIYFLDMILPGINGIELGREIRKLDNEGQIICISSDKDYAIEAYELKTYAYLLKPFDLHKLYLILDEITEFMKKNLVIVKTPDGEIKLKPYQIAYINIVQRNLCYHLTNGLSITGQCLRSSFGSSLGTIKENTNFLFLSPSLLINLNEIQAMNKDHIVFNNNEILYIAKNKYDELYTAWTER